MRVCIFRKIRSRQRHDRRFFRRLRVRRFHGHRGRGGFWRAGGMGLAVVNRLDKAAGFHIVEV